VVYTGLHQTPEMIAGAALQEGVDAVGLSVMSGAHLTLFPAVVQALRAAGAGDVLVFGGGIIPQADVPVLEAAGVARVFGPGTPTGAVVEWLEARLGRQRLEAAAMLAGEGPGPEGSGAPTEAVPKKKERVPPPAPPPARRMLDLLPQRVTVYEVGPRDGLQNERARLPTSAKLELIAALADAGLSASRPRASSRPSGSPARRRRRVARGLPRRPGLVYSALVPNEKA
jgi:methylmalonyl-CoA mutase C-terminal domain/subunit